LVVIDVLIKTNLEVLFTKKIGNFVVVLLFHSVV
jgi:hypothetical protein